MLISAVRDDLCLAFANTLSWRGSETPAEEVGAFADLLKWLERAHIGPMEEVRSWSRDHGRKAAKLFAEAIAIREAIFRAFSALANGQAVPEQDFALVRDALADAPARRQLARLDTGYAWQVQQLRPSTPYLLAPVLWSAADLMLNAPHRRIRQCANDKCLWLFLDESKSGTRRWCDMSACGNRAKAQRHYARSKQA